METRRERGSMKWNFGKVLREVSSRKFAKPNSRPFTLFAAWYPTNVSAANESSFFYTYIVVIGERQNWKEDQNGSTVVDRQNVWRKKRVTMNRLNASLRYRSGGIILWFLRENNFAPAIWRWSITPTASKYSRDLLAHLMSFCLLSEFLSTIRHLTKLGEHFGKYPQNNAWWTY